MRRFLKADLTTRACYAVQHFLWSKFHVFKTKKSIVSRYYKYKRQKPSLPKFTMTCRSWDIWFKSFQSVYILVLFNRRIFPTVLLHLQCYGLCVFEGHSYAFIRFFFQDILSVELYLFKTFDCETCFWRLILSKVGNVDFYVTSFWAGRGAECCITCFTPFCLIFLDLSKCFLYIKAPQCETHLGMWFLAHRLTLERTISHFCVQIMTLKLSIFILSHLPSLPTMHTCLLCRLGHSKRVSLADAHASWLFLSCVCVSVCEHVFNTALKFCSRGYFVIGGGEGEGCDLECTDLSENSFFKNINNNYRNKELQYVSGNTVGEVWQLLFRC